MKKVGGLGFFITNDILHKFEDSGPPSYCAGRLVEPVDLGIDRSTIIDKTNLANPEEAITAEAKRGVDETCTKGD